jgi:hypothetical protein
MEAKYTLYLSGMVAPYTGIIMKAIICIDIITDWYGNQYIRLLCRHYNGIICRPLNKHYIMDWY